jgi:RNA polymerase sigma-70 factor (ECF subfamily)
MDENSSMKIDNLVQRHGRKLYAFVFALTGNHEETDDILQETFLRIIRKNIPVSQDRGDIGPWLNKIAYNIYLDRKKAAMRRTMREQRFEEDIRTHRSICAEDKAMQSINLKTVRDAVLALPDRQREAFTLFVISELSIRETAQLMRCSRGAVMSHIHRARLNLRKTLKSLLSGED